MGRVAKAAGLLVAVCLGFASASNAAIVSYNLLNQPTQILGLTVGANTYNVSIEYDISFDAVYGTGLPPNIMVPTFLGDPSGALAAITEIAAVLNSEGIFPTIFIVVSVPYDATATGYTFSHASAGATYFVGGGGTSSRSFPASEIGITTFTFSEPVPILSTEGLLLYGGLLIATAVWVQRRRSATGGA